MSKKVILGIAAVIASLVVAIGVFVFMQSDDSQKTANSSQAEVIDMATDESTPSPDTVENENTGSTAAAPGRYSSYDSARLSENGYNTNIIFFYAPWCPECRAFKQALENNVSDGVQVLETDYDSSTELKKQYGVTLQSTFVRVSGSGELQKKWVGYGKEKSLEAVLNNVQ